MSKKCDHAPYVAEHPDYPGNYYAVCQCGWWSLVIGPKYMAAIWAARHAVEG